MSLSMLLVSDSIYDSNPWMKNEVNMSIANRSIFHTIFDQNPYNMCWSVLQYDTKSPNKSLSRAGRKSNFPNSSNFVKTLKVTNFFLSLQALSLLLEPGILRFAATRWTSLCDAVNFFEWPRRAKQPTASGLQWCLLRKCFCTY